MIRRLVVAVGCAAAASVMLAGSLAAQTGVLSGVIYDQTNKTGLAGAQVRIKGTELAAVTGSDGRFTIANVPVGTHELEAVRTGYRPFRLPAVRIASPDTAHVYLALSAVAEAPAAIESAGAPASPPEVEISADRILLRGKTMTSVGEISENAPLYIIDGVMLAPGTMVSEIDPKRIESIEVIKGATAESLYGSRAANGVIKITMRRNPD